MPVTSRDPELGPPVIGIVGWKGSGKTTLTVRLVEHFVRRGLRVSTVKHAHHDVEIDTAGTDSVRHRGAGAQQVAVVSPARWAVIKELSGAPEPRLAEVIAALDPCDLVIVEGYKTAAFPKIELRRSAAPAHQPLANGDTWVVAVAADHRTEAASLPVFSLDDIGGIADFIERTARPLEPRCSSAQSRESGSTSGAK